MGGFRDLGALGPGGLGFGDLGFKDSGFFDVNVVIRQGLGIRDVKGLDSWIRPCGSGITLSAQALRPLP